MGRLMSVLPSRRPPPLALGLAVAALLIIAETLLLYPIKAATAESPKGAIYLIGVLVVSTVWGARLGAVTSVLSAFAYNYFHIPPFGRLTVATSGQDVVRLLVFTAAGLLVSILASRARLRTAEATERRREADLATELANLMLGAAELRSALSAASQRLAQAFELPSAAIELDAVAADERRAAFALCDGDTRLGTLLVPADLSEHILARLQQRVVPPMASLLHAALDRETITNSLKTSREQATSLAEQQASLRRVATLVARGAPPDEVFDAVIEELGRFLGWDRTALLRYEPDGTATIVAARGWLSGVRSFDLDGDSVLATVLRTGRAARMNSYEHAVGSIAELIQDMGIRSGVGVPIVVGGRLWGAAIHGSMAPEPMPADTEARMADFTELVATAVANAESHAQLTASRARVVAAADDARRRLERDLHDGAQQRLVAIALQLRGLEALLPTGLDSLRQQLSETVKSVTCVHQELREISQGLHPAILSEHGLGPAVKALARRSSTPVELMLAIDRRLPERVEIGAYYIVSEALTNAAKHARATVVNVDIEADHANLRLSIRDNGIGGATPGKGSGLIGLRDRVETLGGHMEVASPPGHGTALLAELPVNDIPVDDAQG
ncbi:DUF4118 domain-containing protein [Dactylosporangium roseum]|uniref:histidine kinase n=1 Tax=Dactylosporangium roseum TaxID=47989 RepID=A0ABY5Z2C8_9ACTN|nr:DUF4118 domain-containing protein [Dactylosporangium roseum]UWZ36174.1 DUF4118 domain-containing protein [Dactylosporangium roseum]